MLSKQRMPRGRAELLLESLEGDALGERLAASDVADTWQVIAIQACVPGSRTDICTDVCV